MHVLNDEEARMAARLLALYPALYNTVSDLHGFPEMRADEREAIDSLVRRLERPAISVEQAVRNLRRAEG